ncbi:MAG: class I tRNA ligase family protein, partial [Alphaproteobacteria bacterium]|nr:class I tRNA ligase family protein [Alphaproteobacteria bacterium]
HHENEIAQSEGAHHDHPLARYWLHNGHLQVEGAKMSKSLGNFVTIHELLLQEAGDVIRFNMLRTHYRQPLDWRAYNLTESFNTVVNWERTFRLFGITPTGEIFAEPVLEALLDDLNTPQAVTELHALHRAERYQELANSLAALGFKLNVEEARPRSISKEQVEELIQGRNRARKARKFEEADSIRDYLLIHRIVLKDNKDGTTTWEVKR